jgi:uncharacterized membrane protein
VRDRWDTGRIEAFSDGVFSIAATLLVLEIAIPEADFDHLWKGIADQWPAYLGYATSFLTIVGIWLVHHAIFRRLRFADLNITRLNLLLLMAIAFLPFPTKLVAEAIESSSGERAAVLFYGGTLLVISILVTAIIRYGLARGPDRRGGPRGGRGCGGTVASEPRLLRRRLGSRISVARGRRLRLPRDRGADDDPARRSREAQLTVQTAAFHAKQRFDRSPRRRNQGRATASRDLITRMRGFRISPPLPLSLPPESLLREGFLLFEGAHG